MFKTEFTSESFIANPAPHLARLRSEGPLIKRRIPIIGETWFTTNQKATAAILKDNANFTQRSRTGKTPGLQWWMPRSLKLLAGNMLTSDEPDHTRLRGIVDEAFHRRNVMALESRLEQIADNLTESLFEQAPVTDLVKNFARVFPLAVICELLGLPESDRRKFMDWANGLSDVTNIISFLMLFPSIGKMSRFLDGQISIARTQPGEGLISELVSAQAKGAPISDDELLATVFILLVAGHETTTHLISGGVHALLANPEQLAQLRQNWSGLDLAVEEILRFVSAVAFTKPRNVQHDIMIEGVRLRADDLVMPMLLAANYDPAVFDSPESLDLSRKPNRHMAFGTGIHFCLGHQLARLEIKIALRVLLQKYPDLTLADNKVTWRRRMGLRALRELNLREKPD